MKGEDALVDMGMHEYYVNAEVDDGTDIAALMRFLKDGKGEHPRFPVLSAAIRELRAAGHF